MIQRIGLVSYTAVPGGDWNNDQVNFNGNYQNDHNHNARFRAEMMGYVL